MECGDNLVAGIAIMSNQEEFPVNTKKEKN